MGATISRMTPAVEIFSAADPVYFPDRRVWYWVVFEGTRSEDCEDWATVNSWALSRCAEHGTCLIDRSDKGSGFLRATLGR